MGTHVIMKKSLAKALMDAGMEHFDAGGAVPGVGSTTSGGLGTIFGGQNSYQAVTPTISTQDNLVPGIATQEGIASSVLGQQQSLGQTLLQQSQGGGPNPAQAALSQNTGINNANAASMIASTRGATANPALAAELAARAGANNTQQAAGQAATLQQQQELAEQQQLEQLYSTEGSNALQAQSILQGAQASQNSAETTGQLGAEETNAGLATANTNNASSSVGGLLGALGGGMSALSKIWTGGKVPNYDAGGIATYATPMDPRFVVGPSGAGSNGPAGIASGGAGVGMGLKAFLSKMKSTGGQSDDGNGMNDPENPAGEGDEDGVWGGDTAETADGSGMVDAGADAAAGAAADEGIGAAAAALAMGGGVPDFRSGQKVPGRALFPGKDDPRNDTVLAVLTPGEDVLPLSVSEAPDAPQRAKAFVQALQDQKGEGKGFGKVLKAKATLKDRVARLEKLCAGGMA